MTRRLTGDVRPRRSRRDRGQGQDRADPRLSRHRPKGRAGPPARAQSVGLDSPMVGRAEQLERLTSLLDIIAAGRGRAAFIVGEPGIGKSRLLAELKIAALAPPSTTRWFEGRCVSYGRNLPYHLLIDLLRSILGFSFRDGVGGARARRRPPRRPGRGPGRGRGHRGVPRRPARPAPAAGRRSRPKRRTYSSRYIAATHRLLRGLAARGPVVVVCEDITGPTRRPSTSPASSCRSRASCPSSSSRRCAPRRTPRLGPHRPRAGAVRRGAHRSHSSPSRRPAARPSWPTCWRSIAARARARPDPREVGRQPVLRRRGRPNAHRARRDRAGRHALGRHRGRRLDRDPGDAARAAARNRPADDAKRSLGLRR